MNSCHLVLSHLTKSHENSFSLPPMVMLMLKRTSRAGTLPCCHPWAGHQAQQHPSHPFAFPAPSFRRGVLGALVWYEAWAQLCPPSKGVRSEAACWQKLPATAHLGELISPDSGRVCLPQLSTTAAHAHRSTAAT